MASKAASKTGDTQPSLWRQVTRAPRHQQSLAFLRIAAGLYFLMTGLQKFNDPHFESSLGTTLTQWAQHNPLMPYQSFLKQFVIPHATQVAQWVTDGELAVGVSYISGFLIRFSAPLAILLNLNFLLATHHLGASHLGVNLAFIAISLTLYLGEAGNAFGLDGLRPPKPGSQAVKSDAKSNSKSGGKRAKKADAVIASLKATQSNDDHDNDDSDDDDDSSFGTHRFKSPPRKSVKTRLNPF